MATLNRNRKSGISRPFLQISERKIYYKDVHQNQSPVGVDGHFRKVQSGNPDPNLVIVGHSGQFRGARGVVWDALSRGGNIIPIKCNMATLTPIGSILEIIGS